MTQTQSVTSYIVQIPTIPGADMIHARRSTAEREYRAAHKAGHAATILEVLVRPRKRR